MRCGLFFRIKGENVSLSGHLALRCRCLRQEREIVDLNEIGSAIREECKECACGRVSLAEDVEMSGGNSLRTPESC